MSSQGSHTRQQLLVGLLLSKYCLVQNNTRCCFCELLRRGCCGYRCKCIVGFRATSSLVPIPGSMTLVLSIVVTWGVAAPPAPTHTVLRSFTCSGAPTVNQLVTRPHTHPALDTFHAVTQFKCSHFPSRMHMVGGFCDDGQESMKWKKLWRDVEPNRHLEKSPRRGLLDQAQVRTPYTPPFLGSFAYNTPRYGTGCPTPCKIIILGEKMIPQ